LIVYNLIISKFEKQRLIIINQS